MDFVRRWSEKAEIGVGRFIPWLGVTASKFYDWRQRYGCVSEHNSWVPRDFWLEPWEKEAIIEVPFKKNPLEGYRRLTFMMLDADVYGRQSGERAASVEASWIIIPVEVQAIAQGPRFRAAAQPHQHWHIDVSLHQPCVRHCRRWLGMNVSRPKGCMSLRIVGRDRHADLQRARSMDLRIYGRQSRRGPGLVSLG